MSTDTVNQKLVRAVAIQLALADGYDPHHRVVPVDNYAAERFPNGRRALYRSDAPTHIFDVPLWTLYQVDAERIIRAGMIPPIASSAMQAAADEHGPE